MLGNFTDADIGEPILDVILEAGDLLYFPRGLIHQVGLRLKHCVTLWDQECPNVPARSTCLHHGSVCG